MRSSHFSLLRTPWANNLENNGGRRQIVRFNNSITSHSPTFVPLTVLRGLAGVAFLCLGEFFWVHLHRIDLRVEAKVLGGMALGLGSAMAFGAIMGAAVVSFSADEGCRIPLLATVYISAPLSIGDFIAALTFTCLRAQLLRLDSEHFRQHQKRNRPDAWESSGDDQFGRVYDVFIFLALAFSVLEMLMFHLGRRRLVETSFYERGLRGAAVAGGGNLRAGPLRSLLDEEDLREAAWESRGMQNETVQQNCLRQQRYDQLQRLQLEKTKAVLAQHARGGPRNNSL